MAKKVFGIDLGTTYSCISYIDTYDQPTVAPNVNGNPTTPSVVMFGVDGTCTVGEDAKRESGQAPDRVVSLVKRHMGDPDWRFTVGDHQFSAPEVSSKILNALVQDANNVAGEDVEDVVITVPAYFGIPEREATRAAGEVAGLNVVDIINEPTAAAFTYGFGRSDGGTEETVMVYDLGGGTFDVTVMKISGGQITVVATDGDHELGGDNWDQHLVEVIRQRFMEENPDADDPMFDPSALAELKIEAEAGKRKLSNSPTAKARVTSGATIGIVEVTREEFEEATRELLSQTITKMKACLDAAASLGSPTIERILLVGGSSLMPQVPARIREETGREPQLHEPNLAVAKGAALWGQKADIAATIVDILKEQGHKDVTPENLNEVAPETLDAAVAQAAAESGLRKEAVAKLATTVATNVCSQGFGVQAFDADDREVVTFMLHRNNTLPATVEDTFYTRFDDQASVRVVVWQQATPEEDTEMSSNKQVAEGELGPLPPGFPRGTKVQVRLEMSQSGRLVVSAAHEGAPAPLVLQQDIGRGTTEAEIAESREKMASIVRKA